MLRSSILTFVLLALVAIVADAETFVVSVGIGRYANPNVTTLSKTEKDAKAIAAFYKKGTRNVIVITGKYATKSQIINSLCSQFERAKPQDKIVFYFSGHGYPGGFCPYDMQKRSDGLTYAEVIKIMTESKAKDKIIFADACYSGAVRQSKGKTKPEASNVMMFLSSRSNEMSIEFPLLANGYFTKNLLRGLGGAADSDRDRQITASELFRYVSNGVQNDTKGKQHPVMWGKFPDSLVIVKYDKRQFVK